MCMFLLSDSSHFKLLLDELVYFWCEVMSLKNCEIGVPVDNAWLLLLLGMGCKEGACERTAEQGVGHNSRGATGGLRK
jgi:hypothetical protein